MVCLIHLLSRVSMRQSLNARLSGLVHIARIGSMFGVGLLMLKQLGDTKQIIHLLKGKTCR